MASIARACGGAGSTAAAPVSRPLDVDLPPPGAASSLILPTNLSVLPLAYSSSHRTVRSLPLTSLTGGHCESVSRPPTGGRMLGGNLPLTMPLCTRERHGTRGSGSGTSPRGDHGMEARRPMGRGAQRMCKYGMGCTRAECWFQHPDGWTAEKALASCVEDTLWLEPEDIPKLIGSGGRTRRCRRRFANCTPSTGRCA